MTKPKLVKKSINKLSTFRPSAYLICDNCGFYPLQPIHGHYLCQQCKMPTKCCEGGPIEL